MRDKQTDTKRLKGNEGQKFARKHFVQIVVDDVNWKILHRDPSTGEYWKEFFPDSEMHGGGPPVFERISEEDARREFKFDRVALSNARPGTKDPQ